MDGGLDELKTYIGKSETARDVVTATTIGKLAATLDVDNPSPNAGDPVPFGWHGGFFPNFYRKSQTREDGQMAGGLAPPVPLPRRRLMGTTSTYQDALRIGDAITRKSEIGAIDIVDRGKGPTALITQRESISSSRGLAVVDERATLYFGKDGPGKLDTPPPVPSNPAWKRVFDADPVMIWRLCAWRFNSHRIHFDRDYTTKIEGYPGIVVPITLVSQLMLEMCRKELPRKKLASFSYRSIVTIEDTGPFTVVGQPSADGKSATFWAIKAEGQTAVAGEARFAA
jgi:3-methylfumaryl-CoA hydratase